jgi:hypothetical protein
MATLCEFDENDRFFTTFCDPHMVHTFRLFYTFHPTKDTKSCVTCKERGVCVDPGGNGDTMNEGRKGEPGLPGRG